MRAQAIEHGADEKSAAPESAARREQSAVATRGLAGIPAALLGAPFLLGLQAGAGNAAVTGLIEQRRSAEPPADQPVATASDLPPAEVPKADVEDTPGEDELATLDSAADAPAAEKQPGEPDPRDAVAQDAQAELGRVAGADNGPVVEAIGGNEPGVAIEERAPPATLDVSGSNASAGLAKVAALPPAQLLGSLGSVSAAVGREAAQSQQRLAADPPRRARHPGAPARAQTAASSGVATADRPIQEIPMAKQPTEMVVRRPPDLPQLPAVSAPRGEVPLRDPGLELKLGPLPHLPAEGSADPNVVEQRHRQVIGHIDQERLAEGELARRPLGEDQIFPSVPAEMLSGMVPETPGANGHGAAVAVPEEDESASVIAQQDKGEEISGAVSAGLASLAGQRQQYAEHSIAERAKADAEMTQLEQANSAEQTAERAAAKRDVVGLRGQWSSAQQDLVGGAQREAAAKTSETLATVAQERSAAERQAAAHYQQGQQEADQARRQAEQEAAAEKKKAQSTGGGGVLGAIGSAAQSLLDKAKQAVQSVFERARQLVKGAIERARQLATEGLERARLMIVSTIQVAGTALTAIGDRVLAAFPVLRQRFRQLIQDRIAAAEATVNRLASLLKQSVQAVLNGLGTALAVAVGLMRQGMQAAIDAVSATVRGALDFAKSAISAFGTFAVLVKDVAANPGRWVSNLAAAARDGIKNHLWPDLQASVQSWFNEKVDSVLGLGSAVWSLLKRGGITVAQVGTAAWEGLKAMIPQTVIWVLIEKLVALIVPAAAAVMLIIQALQAAWASLGRIIQAADAFIAFLKGVRWGNAGPLFGSALAKGAVAVIEFISQFLLQRLMGAAGAVAGKIRTLAERIGTRLAATGRGILKGARWVGGKARKASAELADLTRKTIARPQVRLHAWRLKNAYRTHLSAVAKMEHIVRDPSLDPRLKLEFFRTIRTSLKVKSADPWDEMTALVKSDPLHWCLQGKAISPEEVFANAPLTKLVPLRRVFDEMLEGSYKQRFTDFDDWRQSVASDSSLFDPRVHLKSDADMGRFWAPAADANEASIEEAIAQRQLEPGIYADGALRLHLAPKTAATMEFYKPTAFDSVFFDRWQVPTRRGAWGTISTKRLVTGETLVIREAVTDAVKPAMVSSFEPMLPSAVVTSPVRAPAGAAGSRGGS